MTKRQADAILRAQFSVMADKAQASKTDEDALRFTDAAHKLYISLTTYGGWNEEYESDSEGTIPS